MTNETGLNASNTLAVDGGTQRRDGKVQVTFTFDPGELFDAIQRVGDSGQHLGIRLATALLMKGQADFLDAVGLAFYGVTITPPEAS